MNQIVGLGLEVLAEGDGVFAQVGSGAPRQNFVGVTLADQDVLTVLA